MESLKALNGEGNYQVAQIKTTIPIEGKIPKDSLPWRYTYKSGRYSVRNGVITVSFDGKTVSGELIEHGTLIFPGASEKNVLPANVYFFSWPDCSA